MGRCGILYKRRKLWLGLSYLALLFAGAGLYALIQHFPFGVRPQSRVMSTPARTNSGTTGLTGGVNLGNGSNVLVTVLPSQPVASFNQEKIYEVAEQVLQNPPNQNWDASGFVQYVYAQAGISLPRTINQQATVGARIADAAQLEKGDLVFFNLDNSPTQASFVGIYLGSDQVAALTTHGLTAFNLFGPYWNGKFAFGERVTS